jgi:hypothetical protein
MRHFTSANNTISGSRVCSSLKFHGFTYILQEHLHFFYSLIMLEHVIISQSDSEFHPYTSINVVEASTGNCWVYIFVGYFLKLSASGLYRVEMACSASSFVTLCFTDPLLHIRAYERHFEITISLNIHFNSFGKTYSTKSQFSLSVAIKRLDKIFSWEVGHSNANSSMFSTAVFDVIFRSSLYILPNIHNDKIVVLATY